MEKAVDFIAVNRVARRVELKHIYLTQLSAKCDPSGPTGALVPTVDHTCSVRGKDGEVLEIACDYRFAVRSSATGEAKGAVDAPTVAEATIQYLLHYHLSGSDPVADADLGEFAQANGIYHSWPFLRELVFGLTAKMGYPPFTLPVFRFNPKPPEKKPSEDNQTTLPREGKATETQGKKTRRGRPKNEPQ